MNSINHKSCSPDILFSLRHVRFSFSMRLSCCTCHCTSLIKFTISGKGLLRHVTVVVEIQWSDARLAISAACVLCNRSREFMDRLLLHYMVFRILLVLCNVTNKIRKRTDTAIAFTQEYSRVSCPLRNVSTLSTVLGSSKDTHAGVEKIEERTSQI